MIMNRNPDPGFTAVDSIHGIRTNTKANSFQIIHNHSLPISIQILALYRPTQLEVPYHNQCGTKNKETNKEK